MDTVLGCLAVLAMMAVVLAPALVGLRHERVVDRLLREARRHPPGDPVYGLGPRLGRVPRPHPPQD
ncbi:hypothetical protein HYE82_05940 [Streptomyces sp. BR123]|uniref:hypothetical protein n=1 Tax=Streptomyces sp. BR123 TaxID=2749828 RepID=UPI0015C47E72|nr:hypothetical protein [Streptomyces sp. BR123]NXY93941.1 hypothetical protein [Streptomyces sp. BR123]